MLVSLLLTADLQLIFIRIQELVPYGKGILFCFAAQYHLHTRGNDFSELGRHFRSTEKAREITNT
jgi:hypothetical protein